MLFSEIINDMLEYTAYHFKTEEDLFEKYNYHDKDKHENEHLTFVDKTKSFNDMFAKEDTNYLLRILRLTSKGLKYC